jgi:hypothetical protein
LLDPSGKILREVPFPKGYGFFSDLAVDAGGNILLLDSVRRKVFKVAKNTPEATQLGESLKEEAYFPTAIAMDKQGTIFLVDENGSGIVILGPDGLPRPADEHGVEGRIPPVPGTHVHQRKWYGLHREPWK